MVSITLLAVGSVAVAQGLTFGLRTSGMSRERLAARSGADQQMEFARSLNYDSLVLDDSSGLTHSTDVTDPDYWINETDQTFDPDGSGPLSPEKIVRIAGASPALHHFQNPVVQGNTTFSVYMYVTWVDSPTDGLGASDVNTNGNDANGQDMKRVTVTVTWSDVLRGGMTSVTEQSLFSDGQIRYRQPTINQPPQVSCPQAVLNDLTVTYTAVASDPDGSIASVTWNFGDGFTGTGSTVSHTYAAEGTYTVVNTVTDNGGGTATNSALNCSYAVTDPNISGNGGPSGTVSILAGATYSSNLNVTLNISSTANPLPTQMQFSNDGVTWSAKQTYSSSSIWTLAPGDGTRTVYARFYNAAGKYGPRASDTIILDTTAPTTPANLTFTTTIQGANKTVNLSWSASTDAVSGLAGYRVWARLTTGTTWSQWSCTSGTTCSVKVKKTDNYEIYVEAYDNAGNTSAQSNHITV